MASRAQETANTIEQRRHEASESYNALVRIAEVLAVVALIVAAMHDVAAWLVVGVGATVIAGLCFFRQSGTRRQQQHALFVAIVLTAILALLAQALL